MYLALTNFAKETEKRKWIKEQQHEQQQIYL